MNESLEACRWVYNETLATRKNAWEQEQRSVSRYDTIGMLPTWKADKPELEQAHSQVLQEVCTRVDLAFQAFFRRVKAGEEKVGYPRFRGHDRYDSFTYPQTGFKVLDNEHLHLSKIGDVKIKMHRPIEERVKALTVRRDRLGNWYACFSCIVEPKPMPLTSKVIGVDVGLATFATLSNGEKIENPRFFKRDQKALLKARSKRDRADKETPRRRKLTRSCLHIENRITNRRKDFAHKLSRNLVNEYQIIAFEKLDIQDMQDGNYRSMNRSIADVAWARFVQYCSAKAEDAGRTVVLVNPKNTTKMCSRCGEIVPKTLSERVHECPHCGLVLDRDHNAALNIIALGLHGMGSIPRSRSTLVDAE